jgi:hypothetical protein
MHHKPSHHLGRNQATTPAVTAYYTQISTGHIKLTFLAPLPTNVAVAIIDGPYQLIAAGLAGSTIAEVYDARITQNDFVAIPLQPLTATSPNGMMIPPWSGDKNGFRQPPPGPL